MRIWEVSTWGRVVHGEALEVLRQIPDNSIDSLVTDPPAGVAFMNRDWDCFRRKHNPNDVSRDSVFGRTSACAPHSYGESDRHRFVAWLTEIMREVYRVLKPGAHGLVWSLPRTAHWTAWALEDSGFEVRDCLAVLQVFGQGFPKSLDVSKALDRRAGAERVVVGEKPWKNQDIRSGSLIGGRAHEQLLETAPATEEAQQWEGFGTALKPAYEPWILVRKPLSEKNVAENVLKWGTGALNLGACEVRRASDDVPGWHHSGANGSGGYQGTDTFKIRDMSPEEIRVRRGKKGRHAPNLLLEHSPLCQLVGTQRVKGCPATVVQGGKDGGGFDVGSSDGTRRGVFEGYGDAEGMEECDLWACVPSCPVRILDEQAGTSRSRKGKPRKSKEPGEGWGMTATGSEYNDTGGPSRFFPAFYTPKPSRAEKEKGLDDLDYATLNRVNPGGLEAEPRFAPVKVKNNHNTVKSIPLCRWLTRLVCPPGGTILDPFLGSGSIGTAAGMEGFRFLGIEQGDPPGDDRYCQIAIRRMAYWSREAGRE